MGRVVGNVAYLRVVPSSRDRSLLLGSGFGRLRGGGRPGFRGGQRLCRACRRARMPPCTLRYRSVEIGISGVGWTGRWARTMTSDSLVSALLAF